MTAPPRPQSDQAQAPNSNKCPICDDAPYGLMVRVRVVDE